MSTRIGEWVMVIILCMVSPFASTTRAVEPPRRTQPDMFVNSLGLKMIRIEAEPFDAWAPSFADFQKAVTEVSGGLERPPIPHRVTLPGDYYLGEFL